MVNKPRILVVGGTGFVGHFILKEAVNRNWKAESLSSNPPVKNRLISYVDYHYANFISLPELKRSLSSKNYDFVINAGGNIDHSSFAHGGRQFLDEHFNAVLNLTEVLNRKKLKRFIQIGTSDEYGQNGAPQSENLREDPFTPYSLGKVASTHLLQTLHRTEKFPSVVIRLFLTYGPCQKKNRFIPQVIENSLKGCKFPVSEGEQTRDFCFITDVVNAIFTILEAPGVCGEIINIGSGCPVKIKDLVKIIIKLIGKGEPQFGELPYRKGENMCLYANIHKAKEILKWVPKVSLTDGLTQTINWYDKHLKNDSD